MHGVPCAASIKDDQRMLADASEGMPSKVALAAPLNLEVAVLGVVKYDEAAAINKMTQERLDAECTPLDEEREAVELTAA